MSKKLKKKKKPDKPTPPVSENELAQMAQSAMESGKFRKAREVFKQLVKLDMDSHRPSLLQAQERLFDQLMQNSRYAEAKQVLAEIKKIPGRAPLPYAAELRLSMALEQFGEAALAAVHLLSQNGQVAGVSGSQLADALVLAFTPAEELGIEAPDIRSDLAGILNALERVSQNGWSAAQGFIKPIGLKSIFIHWKWFIKGLCAFHAHQDEKARQAFAKLEPQSAPARAAGAYLLLLEEKNDTRDLSKSPHVFQHACELVLESLPGDVLARADYLWKVGRFRDSFRHLKAHLDDFPTRDPGPLQALTSFYYAAFREMEFGKAVTYVDTLVETASKNHRSTAFEKFLALRDRSVLTENELGSERDAVRAWENTLASFKRFHPENDRAKALVYTHLGDHFRKEEAPDDGMNLFFFRRKKRQKTLRDARLAESCYLKSLSADPGDRNGWFGLLSLYETLGEKPKINRTLDDIIKRFPEEKDALYKAGLRCVERNAAIKGMNYLEQAMQLDPVDGKIREGYIVACLKVARQYAENGRMDKCRSVLEKAAARASLRSDDFNRGLSYLYARWGLLEILAGDRQTGEERLRQAESLALNPLKLHYFIDLIGRVYNAPPETLKNSGQVVQKTLDAAPNAETGGVLIEVIQYLKRLPRRHTPWLDEELRRLNSYLIRAARKPCSRQRAETIIDYAMNPDSYDIEVANEYIESMLRENPTDARFLWIKFNIQSKFHKFSLETRLKKLERIGDLARTQGEQKVAKAIQEEIESIEERMKYFDEMKHFLESPFWLQEPDESDEDPFFQASTDGHLDSPNTGLPRRASRKKQRGQGEGNTGPRQLDLFDFNE